MLATDFFILISTLCCIAIAAPPNGRGYIIKLKPQANQATVLNLVNQFTALQGEAFARLKHTYSPDFYNGFSGEFSKEFLGELQSKHASDIEYIKRDGIAHIYDIQNGAPWGLVRVGRKTPDPNSSTYDYPHKAGEGVSVYVLDTGVDPNNPDFEEGSVVVGPNFVKGEDEIDLSGHGTHCVGTVGSKTYGVAKKSKVFAVKVMDKDGSGEWSDVIAGIDWVVSKVKKEKSKGAISLSLGGSRYQPIDDAVYAASATLPIFVAAGNEYGADACETSPSGAKGVFTVGATNIKDEVAVFSNTGKCVRIWAPGEKILSTWLGGDTKILSGTSMACPHVAAIAAIYQSQRSFNSSEALYKAIQDNASVAGKLKIAYNKFQ